MLIAFTPCDALGLGEVYLIAPHCTVLLRPAPEAAWMFDCATDPLLLFWHVFNLLDSASPVQFLNAETNHDYDAKYYHYW